MAQQLMNNTDPSLDEIMLFGLIDHDGLLLPTIELSVARSIEFYVIFS